MLLNAELERLGYRHDPETFRELLADRFAERHPGASVDDMLCDEFAPREFVRDIRVRSGLMMLDHALILRSLFNIRKRGVRPLASRSGTV